LDERGWIPGNPDHFESVLEIRVSLHRLSGEIEQFIS
jgi:hypothetical protein